MFYKDMSCLCLFSYPHLTTYHSSVDVQIIIVLNYNWDKSHGPPRLH